MTLNYGAFMQTMFDFLIVAFAVFVPVKTINKLKRARWRSRRPRPRQRRR